MKFFSKLPSLLSRYQVSQLGVQIASFLFVVFFIIELIFMIPFYFSLKERALHELEVATMNQIKGELLSLSLISNSNSPFFSKALENVTRQSSIIKGLTVMRKDGSPLFHSGEKIGYPLNQLTPLARWINEESSDGVGQENRFDVAWDSSELGLPFDISARLDSSQVTQLLKIEVKRLFVLSFMIALIFTLISMLILQNMVLLPLMKLVTKLSEMNDDVKADVDDKNIQHSFSNKKPSHCNEIGTLFKLSNNINKKISNFKKTIAAHEAIMQLGVNERVTVLDQITNYDVITGLPNRNLLKTRLNQYIANSWEEKKLAAVLLIELRDYHEISNVHGRQIAEQFIKEITKLMLENMPSGGTLAHFSTIRLAIARNVVQNTIQVIRLAQLILDIFSKPITIAELSIVSTVNIGIAIYPNDGADPETLLVNANLALNRARAEGPNSLQFYEANMNTELETRRTMLVDLHHAIEKQEFKAYYQPQVDLKTGKIIGFEALIRWQHPGKGLIPPSLFIPLAEESGLITTIGEWILRTACKQTKAWQEQGFPMNIAINLSTIQFKQKNIVEIVNSALIESGLPSESLELEITESGIMKNLQEAVNTMNAFKGLGVTLSIDDFGTGYSSLSYLKRFPVHKLKIDLSFVKDLVEKQNGKPLADIIILLGHSLNLKVIAEGVETEAQLNYLKSKDCDEVQGYYFGKPIPPEECIELIRKLS